MTHDSRILAHFCKLQKKKTDKEDLSSLLGWAHHDCTSEESAPTKDNIINDLVARQHEKGIYTVEGLDPNDFDVTKVRPGSILYVYAESSKGKKEIVKDEELMEVSEQIEGDEENQKGEDEDDDEEEEEEMEEESELDD